MNRQQAIEIIKSRVTKYFKRTGTKGNYKYYYTQAEYDKAVNDGKEKTEKKVKQTDINNKEVSKIIKENEINILKKTKAKYEKCIIFDTKGNKVFEKKGEQSSIEFDEKELLLFKNNIFIHNHPSGRCFSKEDIFLSIKAGMAEIRACVEKSSVDGNKGTFVFKHEIKENKLQEVVEIYTKISKKINDFVFKKADNMSGDKLDEFISKWNGTVHFILAEQLTKELKDKGYKCDFYFEKF